MTDRVHITSDGTYRGTHILVDGKPMPNVRRTSIYIDPELGVVATLNVLVDTLDVTAVVDIEEEALADQT